MSGKKKNGVFSKFIDWITLSVMSLFSGKLKKSMIAEQYEINKEEWKRLSPGLAASGGFIEKQSELSGIKYGTNKGRIGKKLFDGREMNGSDNTCEVIAVYNAMQYIFRAETVGDAKNEMSADAAGTASVNATVKLPGLPELLRSFSKKGIAYKGMFGTNPRALKKYLREKGYTVEELKASKINQKNCESFEKEYSVFVFTTFNKGQNPFSMVHTMCITAEDQSDSSVKAGTTDNSDASAVDEASKKGILKYQIHNDYEGSKCYDSLYEAVMGYNEGKGHPLYLLAVKK